MYKIKIKYTAVYIFIIFSFLFAQDDFKALYSSYKNHDYIQIQNLLSKINGEKQNSLDYKFYKALFNTNGEQAQKIFQTVFEKGDQKLKKLAAKKLMDYYYAKGYYVNASKYQEFLIDEQIDKSLSEKTIIDQILEQPTREPELTKKDSKPVKYFIQVGAFSLEENATQLVKMLATQNIRARIVERKIEQKKLYCVWLDGKEDFKRTYDYANVIKEKYDLKFRIIK